VSFRAQNRRDDHQQPFWRRHRWRYHLAWLPPSPVGGVDSDNQRSSRATCSGSLHLMAHLRCALDRI
jgi:hypothetical protein